MTGEGTLLQNPKCNGSNLKIDKITWFLQDIIFDCNVKNISSSNIACLVGRKLPQIRFLF